MPSMRSASAVVNRSSKYSTGTVGRVAEPLAECAGFGRFLTFTTVQMDGQADDEPADALVFSERGEVLGVERWRTAGVVFERAGDADFGIGECDADADGAVVDACDSHGNGKDAGCGMRREQTS